MLRPIINPTMRTRLLQPSYLASSKLAYTPSCSSCSQPRFPPILSSRHYSKSASFSNKSRDLLSNFWEICLWLTKNRLTIAIGSGLFTSACFVTKDFWFPTKFRSWEIHDHQAAREAKIYATFERPPKFRQTLEKYIPRTDLTNLIRKYITPSQTSRRYPLIIGEHGTGKSSLIQLATESIENPTGIIYVDTPNMLSSASQFAQVMQKTLGWEPDPVLDTSEDIRNPSFIYIWNLFLDAADKYQANHGTIPVLIIDNANRLAEKQPELFDEIQDEAKRLTDQKQAHVVFVSSEGHIPRRMTARSSWSRAGRVIEVGDITEKEAIEYLKLQGIKNSQVSEIYDLVGGRLIDLQYIADEIINNSNSLEAMRTALFARVEEEFGPVRLLDGSNEKEAMVIHKLLEHGSISYNDYNRIMGPQDGDAFLRKNVFAFHYNSRRITFQSNIVKRFCEEYKDEYWPKKDEK